MRIRRKPWARPELKACNFFIDTPENKKGLWLEQFRCKNPIYLELGCGKGTFIAKMARQNSNINFIALDIKSEMLALSKRNIEREYREFNRSIDNVLLSAYDISRVSNIFSSEDKIDRIYINFCNPWPKKKHKKRRLTHTRQLTQYKEFLKPGGKIYFKTDDDNLFDESLIYFKDEGFNITYKTYDLHESDFIGSIETEHEKMFSEQGIKIKFLIAQN